MNTLKATVIIAVYNDWPLLELILEALKAQWQGDFDVAIADDGSRPDFVQRIEHLSQTHPTRNSPASYPFQIKHYWHADDGFGKTIVLNQAVKEATHPYLIFIDGDCIPQHGFVQDHLRYAKPRQALTGRRIDLPHRATEHLDLSSPTKIVAQNVLRLLGMSLTHQARNIEKGLRIDWPRLNLYNNKPRGLMGCNMSMFKQDLLEINGFDERFRAQWGAEDSDIDRRLNMIGVQVKCLLFCATMVHFDASYDKRAQWALSPPSTQQPPYFKMVSQENQAYTPYGIRKKE